MRKNILVIIATFIIFANASSQSGNFRVVERGTENVVTSIHMEPDEFIGLCLQGKAGANADRWVDVAGRWDFPVPFKYMMPMNANCADISYDREVNDSIRVTIFTDSFPNSETIIIPLIVKYAVSMSIDSVDLLNDTTGIKYGDTLLIRMTLMGRGKLVPEEICSDSIYYKMYGYSTKGEDTLSELLINSEKRMLNQMVRQCFRNGQDTIKVILKDSTKSGQNYLFVYLENRRVFCKFIVSASNSAFVKKNYSDQNRNFIFRDGLLQFKAGFTTPVTVKVLTINGEIVHNGVYNPAKNTAQQYRLPSSLPNGYYLLSLNANGERSILQCMIMR